MFKIEAVGLRNEQYAEKNNKLNPLDFWIEPFCRIEGAYPGEEHDSS